MMNPAFYDSKYSKRTTHEFRFYGYNSRVYPYQLSNNPITISVKK